MKRFFYLLITIFFAARLFAYDGAVSGHKNLMVHKTKWFDVIYAKENERTARILIAKADDIYEQAAEQYGIRPQCRMPLVISQKVEEFNANWSSYPYNHIVIYDTSVLDEIDVFEDTLLSVFRHEITHSITFNMKNGFWEGVSRILGDPVYPASITISRGMAEGAAVASESSYGQGRLNNEYFRHMVKQAKIEGSFPSYRDVQGASDKYPAGAFYNFNGEFARWIQEKYSLKDYADFWYRLVNLKSISVNGAFEKAFGQSLSAAWAEFKNSYKIPISQEEKNPLQAGFSEDFFNREGNDYSGLNSAGALYSCLKKCDDGLIFIDSKTKSLYFTDKNLLSDANKKITPKKLFTLTSMESADISSDGRYISIIFTDSLAPVPEKKLKIYDRKTSSFFDFKDSSSKKSLSGISGGTIIKNKDNYYLVCQLYASPEYKILTFRIEGRKFTKISEITLPYGTRAVSFAGDCPGNSEKAAYAFIQKTGLSYSISSRNLDGEILWEKDLPVKGSAAKNLSYDRESRNFYFSYTIPGSMPRLAGFSKDKDAFTFSSLDLSGGIFSPVRAGNKLFYIGNFYRQNRLLVLKDNFFEKNERLFLPDSSDTSDSVKKDPASEDFRPYQGELSEKKYHRHNYLKGLLLPLSTVTSTSYNYGYKSAYSLPAGLTYINANPWTNGFLTMSAGYGYETNSAGFQADYQSGTFTNLLKYKVTAGSEFDSGGWKQASGSLSLNSTIPFGRISNLILTENTYLHYGRSNLPNEIVIKKSSHRPGQAKCENKKNYFYASDSVSLGYSNIHKAGDGKYSNLGFSLSASFISRYNANNKYDLEKYDFYSDLGFSAALALPRLLPLQDDLWFTYNLPANISLNILNNSYSTSSFSLAGILRGSEFPAFNAASVNLNCILFACDIQKGAGIVFFNDFKIAFHYMAGFSYFEEDNDDNWRIMDFESYLKNLGSEVDLEQFYGLKATAGITPNYGNLANYIFKFSLYFEGGIAFKGRKSCGYASLGAVSSF